MEINSANQTRRVSEDQGVINHSKRRIRVGATVCYSAPNVDQLQWLSTISTSVLMLVKGTAIHKSASCL
ncbi:hypothetical protein Leryth_014778 [Lithospermum erythrorhizon]|nr:hypothetical protein Leryth_014778 [Lithospermum erythrorhizon]